MCGFRPTGRLHLGHYFSVIKPGVKGVKVLVANYHAPEEQNCDESVNALKSFGVKDIIFQRDVFNPDLFFKLLSISKIGDLRRMTQFKSLEEIDQTAQLMTYPVLMAHDIAGYDEVYVGEDQTQHIQYARKLLRKYNDVYGTNYPMPVAKVVGGRIRDLQRPEKKMSKSSPQGCLFLDDTSEEISLKIKKANTNEEGLNNLRFLYKEFVPNTEIPDSNQKMKEILSEVLIKLSKIPRLHALNELTRLGQEMGLY